MGGSSLLPKDRGEVHSKMESVKTGSISFPLQIVSSYIK